MKLLHSFAALLAVALVLLPARHLPAAETAALVDRLPANAVLAVVSDDVAATCRAFQKTSLGAALCGEPFAPLVSELAKRDQASLLWLRPLFGFDWSDLAGVSDPGGIVAFPLADGSLGTAWLFVSREPLQQTPACLTAAAKYFNDKGFRGTAEERSGANFTRYEPPAARKEEGPRVLFTTATVYGVANSQAAADVLVRLSAGAAPTNQAGARTLAGALPAADPGDAADVTCFVQPFDLWSLLKSQRQQAEKSAAATAGGKPANKDDEPVEEELATARRLGLTGLKSISGRVRFDSEGPCQWSIDATVHTERPYKGVLRLLELRPGALPELPDWLPANALSVGRWRWDFPLAMKAFGNLYDQANEPGPDGEGLYEDLLDGLRDDPEGVRVDLRRELFEQLGPEMWRASDAGRPAAAGASDPSQPAAPRRWLYVAKVRDVPTVAAALARFYKGDDRVRRETLGPYDVWTVGENASLFVEGESDSLVTVRGLALGKGQLMFSTDVDLLRTAISPPDETQKLRDDPAWASLLAWTKARETGATAFESLVRMDDILEPSYRSATAGPPTKQPESDEQDEREPPEPLAARLWRVLLFGSAEATDAPYALAPAFNALREALPPAAIVISQTENGWSIHVGVLRVAPTEPSAR